MMRNSALLLPSRSLTAYKSATTALCFVAQMPRGMRRSLYVRDDDTVSLPHGSYVTSQTRRRMIARIENST